MMKKKRDIFGEIMSGVDSMKQQREGKITLKNYKIPDVDLPEIDAQFIRKTREKLNLSQGLFAKLLHVNQRTLANWEQGRSRPNDQAVALILLVREYPDTIEKLRNLAA
jgi:putative transcriptional regulator